MIQNVQILPRNELYWQDNEWKKLLSSAIEDPLELLSLLDLEPQAIASGIDLAQKFPQKVPLPFIKRMAKGDSLDPLLLQVLPVKLENMIADGFSADPLGEQQLTDGQAAVPGLLHKYKSRVLFMLATHCAINCRYCFRREFPYKDNRASKSDWIKLEAYLQKHSSINEVIISGGDPLAVTDQYLTDFVAFIAKIKQVKRLRIHTRLPIVIPQRVTSRLLQLAKNIGLQMVMVIHSNHPQEIDGDVEKALLLLKAAGFHLLNQSVLLKGINDNSDVLAQLSERLFECGVSPYYLHLLDRVQGTQHFEVTQNQAVSIMRELQKKLAGFLVPKLVREISGKSSKTLIQFD